ncbi:uncharacterized protein TNCV_240611 [Trichonephila clavipes]|nr:uncharacterized protein TNCV_240611 [Trichonephila clavipes]
MTYHGTFPSQSDQDDETDEDEDNNNSKSRQGPSNVDAFSVLETAMEGYEQESEYCPTQLLLLKRIRDRVAKKPKLYNVSVFTYCMDRIRFFGYPNNHVSERCPVPIDSDNRRSTALAQNLSFNVEHHCLTSFIYPVRGLQWVTFHYNLMPNVNKMSDLPGILKQLALEVIDGIPLDAGKIYTDGSKGETNTTGSGFLIELPGHVIKFLRRNAAHASVFRIEPIAIMCGLSFINNIRDLAVSEIWILTDNRSSIQHLSNWPSIGDSTSRSILHLFQQLSDQHPIHLQWVPFHVSLLGNEVAVDLAKVTTSNPVDPKTHMVLTSTEI